MTRARERRGRTRGAGPWPAGDPFAVLGLEPAARLTDEDVRAGWRRIAAATHPDHAGGGDPERFARAAAAYNQLRTSDRRSPAPRWSPAP
jgi:curved DNA-binding protein CbpA